ncbi:unnamed protein product [Ixodes hexagonus]
MKVLAVSIIFLLIAGLLSASLAQDDGGETEVVRVRRSGYFCPFRQGACHRHCRSIRRRGGYCAGLFKQTCTCYRK